MAVPCSSVVLGLFMSSCPEHIDPGTGRPDGVAARRYYKLPRRSALAYEKSGSTLAERLQQREVVQPSGFGLT